MNLTTDEASRKKQPQLLEAGDLVRIADVFFRYIVPDDYKIGAVLIEDDESVLRPRAVPRTPPPEEARKKEEGSLVMAAVGLESGVIPVATAAEDPRIGKLIGPYRIERVLSQGGMGRVYLAEDIEAGRLCALKMIRPDRTMSQNVLAHFLREIEINSRIAHPNVVEFYGARQDGDLLYYACEYFEGSGLRERFKGRVAPVELALAIGRQAASALVAAHAVSVVHRDIKPDNILLGDAGWIKLIDFGVAKICADPEYRTGITGSSSTFGTPRYMAPEQISRPKEVGPAADFYGLGATLYYCLTCRPPRIEKTIGELVRAMRTPIVPPSQLRSDLPPEVDAIIMRCLNADPHRRHASAGELLAALDEAADLLPAMGR